MTKQGKVAAANPRRATAHEHLSVFVGDWQAVGQSFAEGQRTESPRASAVPWTSEERYEWLPGELFLLHRWDAMVGSYRFQGIEIIGYDGSKQAYFSHLFDNAGNHGEYRAEKSGNIWRFNGPTTRSVISVTPGGQEMNVAWQWISEGREWLPLCERCARRLKG